MKKIKFCSFLMLVVFALQVMVACGGDDDDDITNTQGTPNNNSSNDNSPSGVEAVDLGLSVKWASFNVGSSTKEGFGDLFAWGELEPKSTYTEENYQYYNTGYFDKNGVKIDSLFYEIIGNKTYVQIGNGSYPTYDISKTKYDVAHVKWGGKWRMPTYNEMKELKEKCIWKWASINSFNGYKITASNGNYIFLPAGGFGFSKGIGNRNKDGNYMSSTLVDNQSASSSSNLENWSFYGIDFKSSDVYLGEHGRLWGFSVRPVMDY